MSARRILALLHRDLLTSLRDRLLLTTLIMPIALGVGLRLLVPSIGAASLHFAVLQEDAARLEPALNAYGAVSAYSTRASLEARVRAYDDAIGLLAQGPDQYTLVTEGNEKEGVVALADMVARALAQDSTPPLPVTETRIGTLRSPVATYGFILLAMIVLMMSGFVVGFHIIEEKESDTLRALTVTPLRRGEFVVGRSAMGLLMPLVLLGSLAFILGIAHIDYGFLALTMLLSATSAILVGFLLGVVSSNQMAGVANGKLLFILYGIAPALAMFLPKSSHPFLYWAPTYWSFRALEGILTGTAAKAGLLGWLGIMLAITGVLVVAVSGRIRAGLTPS